MANLGETLEDGLTDLKNDMISGLVWEGVTVSVKQRRSSKSKIVLDNIGGIVKAGEILALMGPSYVHCTLVDLESADMAAAEAPERRPCSTCSRIAAFKPSPKSSAACTQTVGR